MSLLQLHTPLTVPKPLQAAGQFPSLHWPLKLWQAVNEQILRAEPSLGYSVASPPAPSHNPAHTEACCWVDTFSRQLSSLSSQALQQHRSHNLPWHIFLLLLWCLWELFHVFRWLLPKKRVCLNYNSHKDLTYRVNLRSNVFTLVTKSYKFSGVFIEIIEMHYFLQPSWVPAQKLYPLLHHELCRFWKEQTKNRLEQTDQQAKYTLFLSQISSVKVFSWLIKALPVPPPQPKTIREFSRLNC